MKMENGKCTHQPNGNNPLKRVEIEVALLGGTNSLDYLIITVISPETLTAFQNWYNAEREDMDWLNELPAPYSSIVITNTTAIDPEPITCKPQRWRAPGADNTRMHPNAFFAMRSESTAGGHAHQAMYTTTGEWIRSGISAGTADRVAAWPANFWPQDHFDADVKPFILALQLDGNPCIRTGTTLDKPIMHEGWFVKQYLSVRPPVANVKLLLNPGDCAVSE